jgi:hypothetical protein
VPAPLGETVTVICSVPRGGGSHVEGCGPDAALLPCAPAVAPRAEQDDRVIGQASEPRGPCLAGLGLPIGMTRYRHRRGACCP